MNSIEMEQHLINSFHNEFQKPDGNILPIIEKVNAEFPSSVILQYYIAVYYEKIREFNKAKEQHLKSIQMNPLFAPPRLNHAVLVFMEKRFDEIPLVEKNLLEIFNKPTLNQSTMGTELNVNFDDNFRIAMMLGTHYLQNIQVKEASFLFKTMWSIVEIMPINSVKLLVAYKEIGFHACQCWAYSDMEIAHAIVVKVFEKTLDKGVITAEEKAQIDLINIRAMQSIIITAQYVINPYPWSEHVSSVFNSIRKNNVIDPAIHTHDRMRIGYISSDFNRNAVGLFISSIFRYVNKSKFDIYVYYTNANRDFVTDYLQSLVPSRWYDIAGQPAGVVNGMMRRHELDVLIDLNSHAYNGTMELILLKPAPIIINYLGFPDHTFIPEYTHRITDKYADPEESYRPSQEQSITLPCSFLCFAPLSNYRIPEISIDTPRDKVHIGIMNKIAKHNPVVRNIWKRIVKKYPYVQLCIKMNFKETDTPVYKSYPYKQMTYWQFDEELSHYYQLFNKSDICVDTYPYAGTATICSGLLMGVPHYTIYDKKRHVSNVSASIMINTDADHFAEYVCANPTEYESRICAEIERIYTHKQTDFLDYQAECNWKRNNNHELFQTASDPVKFVREFESAIETVYKNEL